MTWKRVYEYLFVEKDPELMLWPERQRRTMGLVLLACGLIEVAAGLTVVMQ